MSDAVNKYHVSVPLDPKNVPPNGSIVYWDGERFNMSTERYHTILSNSFFIESPITDRYIIGGNNFGGFNSSLWSAFSSYTSSTQIAADFFNCFVRINRDIDVINVIGAMGSVGTPNIQFSINLVTLEQGDICGEDLGIGTSTIDIQTNQIGYYEINNSEVICFDEDITVNLIRGDFVGFSIKFDSPVEDFRCTYTISDKLSSF